MMGQDAGAHFKKERLPQFVLLFGEPFQGQTIPHYQFEYQHAPFLCWDDCLLFN